MMQQRELSEEKERISEDDEDVQNQSPKSDFEGQVESSDPKDENSLKKRHFSNSKLSFSVPSSKKATGSAKKIATLNVINQQMSAGNSIKRLKGTKFDNDYAGDNLDKANAAAAVHLKAEGNPQVRKKELQTPRGESRNKKHRGMLSPK